LASGFGRTELAKTCQQWGFRSVIRIQPDVWVECPAYRGNLKDFPIQKGIKLVGRGVHYCKDDPVTHYVVIHWKEDLPPQRAEPWFVMTDWRPSAAELTTRYGKRLTGEELFRDRKNKRNGLALRHTKVMKPDRIDRLLLILVLVYGLRLGLEWVAQQRYQPSMWCRSNRRKQCSVFTIGRIMRDRMPVATATVVAAVLAAIAEAAPNWG
jgi:hypothetical protein